MGLPNIGPLELIIILAIALLIVGPGRLPEMGSAIGRTIREFRKASSDMTDSAKAESGSSTATQPQPNTLAGEATPNTTASTESPAAPETAAAAAAEPVSPTTAPAATPPAATPPAATPPAAEPPAGAAGDGTTDAAEQA